MSQSNIKKRIQKLMVKTNDTMNMGSNGFKRSLMMDNKENRVSPLKKQEFGLSFNRPKNVEESRIFS